MKNERKIIINVSKEGRIRTEIKNLNCYEVLGLYRFLHRKIEYDMLTYASRVDKNKRTKEK